MPICLSGLWKRKFQTIPVLLLWFPWFLSVHEASLPSINLQLGQSVYWLRLALAVHVSAGLFPLFSAGGLWFILLWPLLVLSFITLARRDYWRESDTAVTSLRYYRNSWRLHSRKGWIEAELTGERLVIPFLTILRFQEKSLSGGKRKWTVVIFRDAVHDEPYRQLRVYLLLHS
ncbi:protein YgfX [Parendozoicomonas callyspongiae]|uniref:protein YgfX n=1 Tax=Parendozoicomonas callyspongiae TaxID=2942213 RepID=UPI0038CD813C